MLAAEQRKKCGLYCITIKFDLPLEKTREMVLVEGHGYSGFVFSLVSLYMLKQNAYVEYCNNVMGPPESYCMWTQRSQTVPQFKFWSMVI